MKRSLLDPLPRQISTKALAALVAVVVCGTGVAVLRFLESGPGPVHRPVPSVRAAEPASEAQRVPRPARPSSWSAVPSGSLSSRGADALGAFEAQRDAAPCSAVDRDGAPTLARPDAQGS